MLEEEKLDYHVTILDSVFCQDYDFDGYNLNYTGFANINYHRVFCFVDIDDEDLENKQQFTYEVIFMENERRLKGPFEFKSDIFDDHKDVHKVITYGDTDSYLRGMPTLDRMKEEEYDLLVLLGDYSYDIFENDGQKGDDFFELMEPILTKSPFVMTPGNHETADDSLMLNSRFIMPGTSKDNHLDNNYYWFIAGKVLYFSMNLDYTIFTDALRIPHYAEQMYLDLLEQDKKRGFDWYYLAFFTHRPFYNIERAQRTMIDLYSSVPILAILNDFNVDMIITGHTHDFEFGHIFNNYLPTERSDNTLMIISGAAGTDKDPLDSDRYFNLPFKEKYLPAVNGLVELQISKSDIKGIFFKVNDRTTLYEFGLKGTTKYEMDLFMIIGFVFLVVVIAVGLAILLYKFIADDDDEMQEIEKQTDNSKLILDEEEEEKEGVDEIASRKTTTNKDEEVDAAPEAKEEPEVKEETEVNDENA
jgi:predicted phosphodiesterase